MFKKDAIGRVYNNILCLPPKKPHKNASPILPCSQNFVLAVLAAGLLPAEQLLQLSRKTNFRKCYQTLTEAYQPIYQIAKYYRED